MKKWYLHCLETLTNYACLSLVVWYLHCLETLTNYACLSLVVWYLHCLETLTNHLVSYCFIFTRSSSTAFTRESFDLKDSFGLEEDQGREWELPLFELNTIATATNNFAFCNKLGAGGFGPVYKNKKCSTQGVLQNGMEIAVKRLSRKSGQGMEEFKNEVKLISKLQHRNLVRILGCCVELDEKMLIYEYLPNKSLDYFIFHEEQRAELDWPKRMVIIQGIARGILYLHQDSRLRIIHRDLKASNVLLDNEMIPKIADFGMARIFGVNQIEGSTNRVVGTYLNRIENLATKSYLQHKQQQQESNTKLQNRQQPNDLSSQRFRLTETSPTVQIQDKQVDNTSAKFQLNKRRSHRWIYQQPKTALLKNYGDQLQENPDNRRANR
uniref:Protein kinase domain-containing protein n=1 Tax=Brassica oleracea var. oleracea TaxID=109376 RepID=A0A0D3BT68_BRAOL